MTASTLELLGYAPGDRVLIIHADDVGFSHASNVAAFEGMLHGSLTCGSTLVPAPWFMETAALQKQHPEADLGVHMTLTAEYATYRWPALTGRGAGARCTRPTAACGAMSRASSRTSRWTRRGPSCGRRSSTRWRWASTSRISMPTWAL